MFEAERDVIDAAMQEYELVEQRYHEKQLEGDESAR
jgi:pyruvate/2-oxoacid:ferredoxin oxidoreductase alpha subunit